MPVPFGGVVVSPPVRSRAHDVQLCVPADAFALRANAPLNTALEVIVRTLLLDGSAWRNEEDFYRAFLAAVQAPQWHGHNLDALRDSIVTGSINNVVPPFAVAVRGAKGWPAPLAIFMREVESIFNEAKSEGVAVDLLLTEQ
jgi:RNAse (barnase) inhibitor barstar